MEIEVEGGREEERMRRMIFSPRWMRGKGRGKKEG